MRGGPPSGKWHRGLSNVAHEVAQSALRSAAPTWCMNASMVCVEEVADARGAATDTQEGATDAQNDMPMREKAIPVPSGSICELANAAQMRQVASRTAGPSAKRLGVRCC